MADSESTPTRKPLSVRTRFEVFKRDDFACRYCGRRSPDVVLEIDHVIPVSQGGANDEMNLVTSCWDCNRGKSAVPLAQVLTGEDPHDRALFLLERERQLEEYNRIVAIERQRRENELWTLAAWWNTERGIKPDADGNHYLMNQDYRWLLGALKWCPREVIRGFMDVALERGMTKNLRYVAACCRNWKYEHQANADTMGDGY